MNVIYVRKNGCLTGNGSIYDPVSCLEVALTLADSGDIIDIGPGYFHSVFLNVGLSFVTFKSSFSSIVRADYFLDVPGSVIKVSGGSWLVDTIGFPDCLFWSDEDDVIFADEDGALFCTLPDMTVSSCLFIADEDGVVFADEDNLPICVLPDTFTSVVFADESEDILLDENSNAFEDVL